MWANIDQLFPQVYEQVAAMTKRVQAFAESVGGGEEFVYLNYADAIQDPLRSYGAANVKHIRKVAKSTTLMAFSSSGYQVGIRSAELTEGT